MDDACIRNYSDSSDDFLQTGPAKRRHQYSLPFEQVVTLPQFSLLQ